MNRHPRRTRLRSLVGVACASVLVLGATPALAGSSIPGPNEIRSSENMSLLSSTPKTAPLDATNSDLAFSGNYAYQGNYNGFRIWDLKKPTKPRLVTEVLCPGSQNDVSISGNLLFLATDARRSNNSCASEPATSDTDYWEGVKVFDVSNPVRPRYVSAVETDCGSHTLTINPVGKNKVYVYVSSYDVNADVADCQPPHDKISILEVDRRVPEDASLVAEPSLFPDGGNPGDGLPYPDGTRATSGCHDITVFPSKKLAAGACMGDGVIWDLSNPVLFKEIDRVQDDTNFAFWHSATFNNDGTKVIFTDELGGGGAATCVPGMPATRGADGIYDIEGRGMDRELVFKSYYKIPRMNHAGDAETRPENCVAHNGSLVPVKGRDIMVQSWYMGGVSVWDFTDSANPRELGYWERGPVPAGATDGGGTWSAYWYNGYIYSSDLGKGFDVLQIRGPEFKKAAKVKYAELNVQTQPVYAER